MVFKEGEQNWKLRKGDYKGENNPFYGKNHTEETRQRISDKNRGIRFSKETEFKPRQTSNKNNVNWKGNKVGYYAVHSWIRRYKPKKIMKTPPILPSHV